MRIEGKFEGAVDLKVTSAYPPDTLQRIQKTGICVYDVNMKDSFTLCFSAHRRDVDQIMRLCEKKGERVDVEGASGYIYSIRSTLRRPVFLAAIALWLFLALWLPTRVLFVQVSGNTSLPDAYIIECAADCGIRMGTSTKSVRSEQVKNALLSKIPLLDWAGVNTSGCIATVSVKEKATSQPSDEDVYISDLCSSQDAIVKEVTVRSGTKLCNVGQAVKKGQPLISCYVDDGQILRFTGALGEVYGNTQRQLTSVTALNVCQRTDVLEEKTNFYLIIGKNTINFSKDSGILDATCDKMYTIRQLSLPGGFTLPIAIVTEHITTFATETIILSESDCSWLSEYAENYLADDLVAGSIFSARTAGILLGDVYTVSGIYDCTEMIIDFEHKGTQQRDGKDG